MHVMIEPSAYKSTQFVIAFW